MTAGWEIDYHRCEWGARIASGKWELFWVCLVLQCTALMSEEIHRFVYVSFKRADVRMRM